MPFGTRVMAEPGPHPESGPRPDQGGPSEAATPAVAVSQPPTPAGTALAGAPPPAPVPSARPSIPGAVGAPRAVPSSCAQPSLTILEPAIAITDSVRWQAQGFRPGTVARAWVHGPTTPGSDVGPASSIALYTVDDGCAVHGEAGDGVFLNPGLRSGSYQLEVSGLPYGSSQQDLHLTGPFSAYETFR